MDNYEYWSIFKVNNQMKFSYVIYDKVKDMISAKDISWVKFSWEMLKNNGDFAPKIFLR